MTPDPMNMGGVYEIVNIVNGKRYVGSSVNIKKRWQTHKSALHKNCHGNEHLQNAYNKYGKKSFKYKVLVYTEPEEALRLENLLLKSDKYEYNIAEDAIAPMLGKIFSEEHKRKMSIAHKGESNFNYGKTGKDSNRWGKHHTKEARRKIGEAQKGKNNHMYGKHHTADAKRKISENHVGFSGKCHTEETKRKISEAQKGKTLSEEHKQKMSKSHIGKTFSEEHKRKISEANKRAWAKKKQQELEMGFYD